MKSRQWIVFIAIFLLFGGAAFLSGYLAQNSAVVYFSKNDIFGDWANTNQLIYFLIAFVAFWVAFPFVYWCRCTNANWSKRKRKFGLMTFLAILVCVIIVAIGSFLCNFFNPVESHDYLLFSHLLHLSTIPIGLFIALIFTLLIKPTADGIKF
ncbi:MAG: hypothetical protein LBQ68_06250 [Clostridiales bacterium]|nr:hypothetical protein [Clostridiales bacterium]